jgi:hypothetical protein
MQQLAEAEKIQGLFSYEQTLNQVRMQALQDWQIAQKEKLDLMVDELCGVIAESLTKLDKVSGDISPYMKKELEKHAKRSESLLRLVESVAGVNPVKLEELVAKTNEMKEAFVAPGANVEKLQEQLKKLRSQFGETVSLVSEGTGSAELAQWCQIGAVVKAPITDQPQPVTGVIADGIDLNEVATDQPVQIETANTVNIELDLDKTTGENELAFVPVLTMLSEVSYE